MTDLPLLSADGVLTRVALREAPGFVRPEAPLRSRIAYAAAHVVPKAHADNTPGRPADIDWDATLAFRRHVYGWGLGVADAMDTAQRNMGLDAAATRELIARSAEVAREAGGSVVVGVNTDHVDEEHIALDRVIDAYRSQLEFTEEQGAGPVLMASRHLARAAQSAADYRRVYREVLRAATAPVVLHWLGTAFDPALEGYFGSADWRVAADVLLEIIADNPGAVAGVKMSLLDAESEVSVRARLPEGVRMFTGDDFNYVGLIGGDEVAGVSSRSARSTTGAVPDLDEVAGVSSRSARSTTGGAPDPDEVAGVSSRFARSTTGGAPDLDEVAGVSSRSARSTTGEVPAPVEGHSDALLGAFAAITPVASAAIQALDAGDPAGYLRILGPTEALSRQVFAAPTFYYKTGVAFLSWLNGHQAAFQMVGGLHSARSLPHLSRIVELANASQALERPDLAASRWSDLLRLNGVAP